MAGNYLLTDLEDKYKQIYVIPLKLFISSMQTKHWYQSSEKLPFSSTFNSKSCILFWKRDRGEIKFKWKVQNLKISLHISFIKYLKISLYISFIKYLKTSLNISFIKYLQCFNLILCTYCSSKCVNFWPWLCISIRWWATQ